MMIPPLLSLPHDLQFELFAHHLSYKDLCQLGQTCRTMKILTEDNRTWNALVKDKFPDYYYSPSTLSAAFYKRLYGQLFIASTHLPFPQDPGRKFVTAERPTHVMIYDHLFVAERENLSIAIQAIVHSILEPNGKKETFFWASAWGLKKTVTKFLQHDSTLVHVRDDRQMTALHNNAMNGTKGSLVSKLIEYGADINAIDQHGWTPLHWAAKNARVKVCKDLVDNGARIDIRDLNRQTAWDVAHDYRRYSMATGWKQYNGPIHKETLNKMNPNFGWRLLFNLLKKAFDIMLIWLKVQFHKLKSLITRT